MKLNKKDNCILQLNKYTFEYSIIAKNIDIHHSREICSLLKQLHPQFEYIYYKMEYIKANKDKLVNLIFND